MRSDSGKDENSGHWEEVRNISASSIGLVVGGLEAMKAMLEEPCPPPSGSASIVGHQRLLTDLLRRGRGGARRYSAGRVRSAREAKAQAVRRGVALSRLPDWRGRSGDGGQQDRRRRCPPLARGRGNWSLNRGFVLVRRLPRAVFAARAQRRLQSEHGGPRPLC